MFHKWPIFCWTALTVLEDIILPNQVFAWCRLEQCEDVLYVCEILENDFNGWMFHFNYDY